MLLRSGGSSLSFTTLERQCLLTGRVVSSIGVAVQPAHYEAAVASIDVGRVRCPLWHRGRPGAVQPFCSDWNDVGVLILAEDGVRFGAFTLCSEHASELGVLATGRTPGKRGSRAYPCCGINTQTTQSETAQAGAFVALLCHRPG